MSKFCTHCNGCFWTFHLTLKTKKYKQMKKISVFLLLFSSTLFSIFAQVKTIDLESYFKNGYPTQTYRQLSWRPTTQQFTFIKSEEPDKIYMQNAEKGNAEPFIMLNALAYLVNDHSLKQFPFYEWIDKNNLYFYKANVIFTIMEDGNLTTEKLTFSDAKVIDRQPKNRLFISKEDDGYVYVLSGKNDYKPILLCSDTGKHIVFGEAVHRSEWGIEEGQYISAQGNFIAFYRMDENMVEDYPLVHTNEPVVKVEMIKYPMAGRASHQVKVGIFDVTTATTTDKPVFYYIKTNPEDGEFLTGVTFSPNEKELYITHLNREQNQAKLIAYDVKSGEKLRELIVEKDARYVEPLHRMYFLKNNRFIWQSNRNGWNHLYLYDLSGKLIRQITSGEWDVLDFKGVDEKEENLYFIANRENPTEKNLYGFHLKNNSVTLLTPEKGTNTVSFSDDYKYFIDYFSSLETPLKILLYTTGKTKEQVLLNAKNPYQSLQLGKTSIFSIKNKSGDDLYCRMILPPNFDSTQKYPCLIYVYGGPHSQLVTNTFLSGGVFLHYLAQKGYVIFTLDNRGTANRGAEFEKVIHRRLGVLEMEDQLCGVDYLKSLPYIDADRIGLDGWSYGGFLVLSLVSTYPDIFRAASCGGPVVNWEWYEVMYGERYMDTPQSNQEGYAQTNIIHKVKNIKCDLLVMHGTHDHTVMWQHTLELLRQSVSDGVQIDYFVYPVHDHNVQGMERVHLWKKIEKFHNTYLLNGR
jgi:dipeptidyl-peptidase-4